MKYFMKRQDIQPAMQHFALSVRSALLHDRVQQALTRVSPGCKYREALEAGKLFKEKPLNVRFSRIRDDQCHIKDVEYI